MTAHLRAHGWTKDAYCAAFGLERGQSLDGAATRKMRAASFSARLLFEPAIRAGSARGRARARSGELARDAAVAARGRPLPEQRRRKARRAIAGKRHPDSAAASRERARAHLLAVASRVAAENGFADIGALVRARTAQGARLAAISRAAGLHKDWLSRHHADPDQSAAAAAAVARTAARRAEDEPWKAVISATGFADPGEYLRQRHGEQHWSVNQIAAEAGMSYHTVAAALARHGTARGCRTRPPGTPPASGRPALLPASVSPTLLATCRRAGRPGGPGRRWWPRPGRRGPGCVVTACRAEASGPQGQAPFKLADGCEHWPAADTAG